MAYSPITVDTMWGALYIGSVVNAIFFGIYCLQTWIFFNRLTKETNMMKFSVALLWILNMFHLGLVSHVSYFYMVTNFGNVAALNEGVIWSLPLIILITSIINIIVQWWFIYRVWVLSKRNIWVVIFLVLQSLLTLSMSSAVSIKYWLLPNFAAYAKWDWIGDTAFGFEVLVNLSISATLCFYLHRMSNSKIRWTRNVTNGLTIYIINTGLLTGVLCIVCLIMEIVYPNNFIHVGVFYPLSSLYSNALLGSFNARDWFRGKARGDAQVLSIPMSSFTGGNTALSGSRMSSSAHGTTHTSATYGADSELQVHVKQDVEKADF